MSETQDPETLRAEQTLKDLELYKAFVAKCPDTMERFSQFTGSEASEEENLVLVPIELDREKITPICLLPPNRH